MSYDYGASQGGGGFFDFGGQGGGDTGGGGERRKDNELGLRPVTISQILTAETASADMPLLIDDKEVKNVTFVGRVSEISGGDLFSSFKVDDGSGVIDCRLWGTEDTPLPVMDNDYARVRGVVKQFQGNNSISATTVHKVTDPNELVFHGLQTIWAHLYLTKGPGGTEPGGGGGQTNAFYNKQPENTPADRVFNTLMALKLENPDGITLLQIQKRVPAMSESAINDAIADLQDSGRAYSITAADDQEVHFPMET